MLKFKEKSDKHLDNVETKGIQELLLEVLEDLDHPIEFDHTNVEPLEYISRDGFAAFDNNRGGADFIGFTTVYSLMGSGAHFDTKIQNKIEDEYAEAFGQTAEELKINPETSIPEELEQIYEKLDPLMQDEYSGYAWRIRIMYEGENIIVVHSGWDYDAAYYRWSNKTDLEQEITFKNKRDLKSKLKKAIQKAVDNL